MPAAPAGSSRTWPAGAGAFDLKLGLAEATMRGSVAQTLNMLFGNCSLLPRVALRDVQFTPALAARFGGPRFSVAGLRERLGVHGRPLACAAIKPQGLPVAELAALAERFALAGIDVIKDDHGLADQSYSPFAERVRACQRAVEQAERASGGARSRHGHGWPTPGTAPSSRTGRVPLGSGAAAGLQGRGQRAVCRHHAAAAVPRAGTGLRAVLLRGRARGHSTLKRHEHAHAVMVLRGRRRVLLGDRVHAIAGHDLGHIPGGTWHQFRADADAPLGFLCMVDTERDRPQLTDAQTLTALRSVAAVRDFIRT